MHQAASKLPSHCHTRDDNGRPNRHASSIQDLTCSTKPKNDCADQNNWSSIEQYSLMWSCHYNWDSPAAHHMQRKTYLWVLQKSSHHNHPHGSDSHLQQNKLHQSMSHASRFRLYLFLYACMDACNECRQQYPGRTITNGSGTCNGWVFHVNCDSTFWNRGGGSILILALSTFCHPEARQIRANSGYNGVRREISTAPRQNFDDC